MLFTTEMNIGDRVWAVVTAPATRKVRCLTCHNTGNVVLGVETFTCPKCQGKCLHDEYVGIRWVVYHEGIIGQIRVHQVITGSSSRIKADSATKTEVEYMIDTTGITSGTVWKERDLFLTRKLAEAACVRRNEGKNFTDDTLPQQEV